MRLCFRDYVLDTGTRMVTRAGSTVPLSPKAFRLLEALAAQRPNAVSHERLRRSLWGDTGTGGTTLARLVSELRAALCDDDPASPMVRTVHRFGYAFACEAIEAAAMRGAPVAPCALKWGSQMVPLATGENFIGRALTGTVSVPSSKVSRRHACILVSDGRAVLEDVGSRNGTYVDDRRINAPVELKNGDRIRIGPAQLVFCASVDDTVTSQDT